MSREHTWRQVYKNSDVEQCVNCPTQRRRAGAGWQWRPTNEALDWSSVEQNGIPTCVPTYKSLDGTLMRGVLPDQERATEILEAELKELSDRIATDPVRFQQVREELKRRREARDEQPTPETDDERTEREGRVQRDLDRVLTLKIIAMEAEQAKLVVEAELFKSQRDEAAARLALLAKVIAASGIEKAAAAPNEAAQDSAPAGGLIAEALGVPDRTRRPLSHETAFKIALTHMNKAGLFDEPPTWAIDAIVEASR